MAITLTRFGSVTVTIPHYSVTVTHSASAADPYTGNYSATPSAAGSILYTKHKTLSDDIVINPIPYIKATNESGGYTISIAS